MLHLRSFSDWCCLNYFGFLKILVFFAFSEKTFEFYDSTADIRSGDLFLLGNISILVIDSFGDRVVVHDAEGDFFVKIFALLG